MLSFKQIDDRIPVSGAPEIPGLTFRGFCGKADYQAMAAVINGSKEADGVEWALSAEDIARNYRHLVNSDAQRDMLFVEVDGACLDLSVLDTGVVDVVGFAVGCVCECSSEYRRGERGGVYGCEQVRWAC